MEKSDTKELLRECNGGIKMGVDAIDGAYDGKRRFLIFDYCGNFEFFDENPEGEGYADYLLVFDKKDGTPLAKFKFPNKGSHICFSKDGKELYHFTVDTNIDVVKVEDLLEIIE